MFISEKEFEARRSYFLRLTFTVVVFLVILLNSLTSFAVTEEVTDCIYDYSHVYLNGLNQFLFKNTFTKYLIMVGKSLIMDISIVIVVYDWINTGKNWNLFVIILKFLGLKTICAYLFPIKFSQDNLWEEPGFSSISISYNKSNDFFFSGSIGLNLILAIRIHEIWREQSTEYELDNQNGYYSTNSYESHYNSSSYYLNNKYPLFLQIFSKLSYLNIFTQFLFDLAIRSHFLIDILMGLLFAHYFIVTTCDDDPIVEYLNKNLPLSCKEDHGDGKSEFLANTDLDFRNINKINNIRKYETNKHLLEETGNNYNTI